LGAEFSAVGTFKTHVCASIGSDAITDCESVFLLSFWTGFDDNSAGFMTGDEVLFEGEWSVFGENGGEIRVT
jgi:hypothetical protein